MRNGNLTFFSIKECGLYFGEELVALGHEEFLAHFYAWATNVDKKRETLPWMDGDPRAHGEKCYCNDLHFDPLTGDYVVCFWRSADADAEGNLVALDEDEKVGGATVVDTKAEIDGRKLIFGRPMYYWFIPSKGVMASIRFEGSIADTALVKSYFRSVFLYKVPVAKYKKIVAFGEATNIHFEDDLGRVLKVKFDSRVIDVKTAASKVADLVGSVKKVIIRSKVDTEVKDNRPLWVKLAAVNLQGFGQHGGVFSRRLEIAVDYSPSEDEIRELLAYGQTSKDEWDNVGFSLGDHSKVIWSDTYRMTGGIKVDGAERIISASRLFGALVEKRDLLLAGYVVADENVAKGSESEQLEHIG